jgi:hypothetical protein
MYFFWFTVGCWVSSIVLHNKFLMKNEAKLNLIELPDPLFTFFKSVDVSLPITCATWFNVGLVVKMIYDWNIEYLLKAQWMMIIMLLMRTLCIYLAPFKVHKDNVPIKDVFVDKYLLRVLGSSQSFRNDLFFSGHLAHCLILSQVIQEWQRELYIVGILIFICMILSKTHYTIDLIVASLIIIPVSEISKWIISSIRILV